MDNKTLTDILASRLGIGTDEIRRLNIALGEAVGGCAAELDSVALPGLGVFEPRRRMEKTAVHPATGKRLLVPPRITVAFRPSQTLKQALGTDHTNDTDTDDDE